MFVKKNPDRKKKKKNIDFSENMTFLLKKSISVLHLTEAFKNEK